MSRRRAAKKPDIKDDTINHYLYLPFEDSDEEVIHSISPDEQNGEISTDDPKFGNTCYRAKNPTTQWVLGDIGYKINKGITCDFWVRRDPTTANTSSLYIRLYYDGLSNTGQPTVKPAFEVTIQTQATVVSPACSVNNSRIFNTGVSMDGNAWNYIFIRISKDGEAELYINDSLIWSGSSAFPEDINYVIIGTNGVDRPTYMDDLFVTSGNRVYTGVPEAPHSTLI